MNKKVRVYYCFEKTGNLCVLNVKVLLVFILEMEIQ